MSAVALVLVLGAAFAHAGWNILSHSTSRLGLPFLWCGAVAATVIWLPVVFLTGGIGTDDLVGFALGIGVSAVLHVGYMLVLQRGYALGNLSTVYATARGTGPLLSVVAAIILLGERLSVPAVIGVGAVIVGVIAIGLIDRPAADTAVAERRGIDPALVYGLLTGVAIATYTLWDAHSVREWTISPIAYMVGCTMLEVPLYSALLAAHRRHGAVRAVVVTHWRTLIAFGVLSPLSYILVLTAFTLAPVALVAPMREVSVVLVSLFGAFVLREARPGWRVAASVVVVGGIALLAT